MIDPLDRRAPSPIEDVGMTDTRILLRRLMPRCRRERQRHRWRRVSMCIKAGRLDSWELRCDHCSLLIGKDAEGWFYWRRFFR